MPDSTVRSKRHPDSDLVELCIHHGPGNILDLATIDGLRKILEELAAGDEIKALWLRAEGPHFCYGADIAEHLPGVMESYLPAFHGLVGDLLEFPAPTLVLIKGKCLGGGFEIALACDLILASRDAIFALPEVRLGVLAPIGSILLPLKLGSCRASKLLLTGCELEASDAFDLGLVTEIIEPDELEDAALTWMAANILGYPRAALSAIAGCSRWPVKEAFRAQVETVETQYLRDILHDPDAQEGLRAFLDKRPPKWQRDSRAN